MLFLNVNGLYRGFPGLLAIIFIGNFLHYYY